MNVLRLLAGLCVLTALSGCTILNPYHENFDCRIEDGGKCVDTHTAYADALAFEPFDQAPPRPSFDPRTLYGNFDSSNGFSTISSGEERYREQLYRQLTDMIAAPETPMVTPPKIIRILMFPYQAKGGELVMPRFLYVKAEEARWVMDGGIREPEFNY